MTHYDAEQQMAVERYLLGELTGGQRDAFEEHLFDCMECAADLKQGVLFLEAARPELQAMPAADLAPRKIIPFTPRKSPLAWLWQPSLLGPALAACLAVVAYQSAVVVPGLRTELAESRIPAVVEPLVLANAGARGDAPAPVLTAPRHGSYLLSVDIPPAPGASAYRCALYSAAGALLWHVDVPAAKARDAVQITVPASAAQDGLNELRIQSVPTAGAPDDTLVTLASYRYTLKLIN